MSNEYIKVIHPFEPIFDKDSKVLILGSFPSVISRKNDFYFSNPQNRFWKVLIEGVYKMTDEKSIGKRTEFILKNHLALYDVIYSCSIIASYDDKIKDVVPADLKSIIGKSKIKYVFLLGKTSYNLFMKHFADLKVKAYYLPSTSPANGRWTYDNLVIEYSKIKNVIDNEI